MRQLLVVGAFALSACASSGELVPEQVTEGLYRLDFSSSRSVKANYAAAEFCRAKGLDGIHLLSLSKQSATFRCINPGDYGRFNLTDAVQWSPTEGGRGAIISCPDQMIHCHRRASAICEGSYTTVKNTARGQVTPQLGALDFGTRIDQSQSVAVSQYGNATAITSRTQSGYPTNLMAGIEAGAAMRARNEALAIQQQQLNEASKVYGELTVACD